MIDTIEEESEVLPDPLFAEDVIVDVEESCALMTLRFSMMMIAQERQNSKSSWSFKNKSEFAALEEVLLKSVDAGVEEKQSALSVALGNAQDSKDEEGNGNKKRPRKRLKKRRKKLGHNRLGTKKTAEEKSFESFVRAARYVRYGDGNRTVHPSAKLRRKISWSRDKRERTAIARQSK